MLTLMNLLNPVAVEEGDLGLDPDFSAPWNPTFTEISAMVVGTLFIVSGLILAVGIVMFFVAKAASNSRQQQNGITAMLWGLGGVVLLGSIGGIIVWAAGFDLFTTTG